MARKARSLLSHMHVIDDEEKLVEMALALEPQQPRPSPSLSAISLESSSISATSSSVGTTSGNSTQSTAAPPVRSKEPPLVSVTPAVGPSGGPGGPSCGPGGDCACACDPAPKLGPGLAPAPQVVVHTSGPGSSLGGGATGAILSKLSNLGEFILRAISPTHGQRLNTVIRRPKPLISIGSTPQVYFYNF